MGLFDKFLRAIGFESDEEEPIKEDKKVKNKDITNSKFDLSKVQEETEETPIEEDVEVKVFNPESQEEIQECLLKIQNAKEAYINLENFSDEDEVRALDFISGALFILQKSIKRVDAKLFIIKNLGDVE